MRSTVTLRGVSFDFPNGRELFNNLNITLNPGLTALVGPNGIGKSTLARLVAGELAPVSGEVIRPQEIKLFAQREPPPAFTSGEYLSDHDWSAVVVTLLAGVDLSRSCADLSGGQWMRVRLARALGEGPIILDEPTNDLDRAGRSAVFEMLRARTGVTLVISHDRELLGMCENIVELSAQGLKKFGGGWVAYERERSAEGRRLERSLVTAKRGRETLAAERADALEAQKKRNRRGSAAAAKGGESKLLLGRRKRAAQVSTGSIDVHTAERTDEAIREQAQALRNLKSDPVMYAGLLGQEIPAQKLVAQARAFNVRFKDWLYAEDLNFQWRGNIRVALTGPNGSGKTVLIKALAGQRFETRGDFTSGNLRPLYLDQAGSTLNPERSVLENIMGNARLGETEARNGLARFLLTGNDVFKRVGALSGGERLRAALAQAALSVQSPELLILDEPTNNLDLANIEFLERIVAEFRGPVIVISHDQKFIENCGVTEEFKARRG